MLLAVADTVSEGPGPQSIEAALDQIVDLPEPQQSVALERLCAAHPDQANRLRARYAAFRGLLDASALADVAAGGDVRPRLASDRTRAAVGEGPRAPAGEPDLVGPYRIVRKLGAGGMGAVYLAQQSQPFERTVALKLVKLGMDTDEVLKRFEFERQALALMSHDNIARVFDAGRTERGQPYFVMEYVPGTPLTEFADRHTLALEPRLALFLQVCAGVQHAHQRGVIHRVLKPANILVVEQDGRGVPKIIDFGLARATEQHVLDVTQLTTEGCMLGTPAYMSPEQTGMTGDEVDTRTDVYALGVILYELLTGELPFSNEELLADGYYQMARMIREVEPPRPSRRLAALAKDANPPARARSTTVSTLLRALRSDLDWIVMQALQKERHARYASVGEFAADVQRYLADEPVSATAPSTMYRARKLLKRYRVQAIAAVIVLVGLVAGLVVALVFYFDAARAEVETRKAKDRLDPPVLRGLEQEALNDLWPVHPDLVPRLQYWLQRAAGLRDRIGVQRAYLAEVEKRGQRSDAGLTFVSPEDAVDYTEFSRLIADFERFFAPAPTAKNVAGVTERLELARTLRERTVDEHRQEWDAARAAIAAADGVRASVLYRALALVPQLGLVPIGPDPESKLWEFYHPDSGEPGALPARDEKTGRVRMRPELGFVFVLLPGGTFTMGSDKAKDQAAEKDEMPAHEVTLAPFFLSKFECTQAQWKRLFDGDVPSHFSPEYKMPKGVSDATWTNPVEQVYWDEATNVCRRHRLDLPTEAQWEFACRAGATTVFAWGDDPEGLEQHDNVADRFAADKALGWPRFEDWSDGHLVHAPVGCFAPNAFGLHDMHGNVMEMCADAEMPYSTAVRPGNGLREEPKASHGALPAIRIARGGCWQFDRAFARCSNREEVRVRAASDLVGVRPALRVDADGR